MPHDNISIHYPSDIRSVPTTELDIDLISSLCRPIFEEAHSLHPTISWAGIFGSVSRGAQRPDSDVDALVGYSKHADFWRDVCGSINWLGDNLSDVLARKVDVVTYVEDREMAYVHMEALLTAKTIWGDASWFVASRDSAEKILRQGYGRTKKAREMLLCIQKTVLSLGVREQMGGRQQVPDVSLCSH
jgi:predicted nucleotidyltransferase